MHPNGLNEQLNQQCCTDNEHSPRKTSIEELFRQILARLDGWWLNNVLLVLLEQLFIVSFSMLGNEFRDLNSLGSKLVQLRRHLLHNDNHGILTCRHRFNKPDRLIYHKNPNRRARHYWVKKNKLLVMDWDGKKDQARAGEFLTERIRPTVIKRPKSAEERMLGKTKEHGKSKEISRNRVTMEPKYLRIELGKRP